MADTVRNLMELMVPELEDYERRGYFTRTEISSIVSRRQNFEYALRRRNAVKTDFLRYADYEWKLEQLRQLRRKQRNITGKRSLADYGIVRRIHFIFERATRKFKGDLGMWMAWLKFCKDSRSSRQVSKAVTKALKLHPNASFLWTYAAAWEFESNANPVAARLLMQSGLRNCPLDTSLWLEYFRMELLYANKLIARRKALGIIQEGVPEGEEAAAADASILSGALAKLVYTQAVKAAPSDAGLRRRFLEVASAVPCNGTADLIQHIAAGMRTDFAADAEGWTTYAGCIADGLTPERDNCLATCCAALQEGLRNTRTPEMQHCTVAFVVERLAAIDERASASESPLQGDEAECLILLDTLEALATCEVDGEAAADVFIARCQGLLRGGRVKDALAAARSAVAERPADWRLWVQHFQARMLGEALGAANAASAEGGEQQPGRAGKAQAAAGRVECDEDAQVVRRAMRAVAQEDVWRLWQPALLLSLSLRDDEAREASLRSVGASVAFTLRVSQRNRLGAVVAALYTAVLHLQGMDGAERLALQINDCPSPGMEYWETRLRLLLAHHHRQGQKLGSPQCPLQPVFEKAVQAHGEDSVTIWKMWVDLYASTGRSIGQLTWRAAKQLRPDSADDFAAVCNAHGTA